MHEKGNAKHRDRAASAAAVLKAPVVGLERLREGLFGEIGSACEAMQRLAESPAERTGAAFRALRARLGDAWALLDTVGWAENETPRNIEIDLREHHAALGRALELALLFAEDDLRELEHHAPPDTRPEQAAHARRRRQEQIAAFRDYARHARRQIASALDESPRT